MAENPVGHVATVACAERALTGFVDEWIVRLGVVEAAHQVNIRLATPVAVHAVHKGLSIAGRAARIDHQNDVSIRGQQLRIPAIAPAVSPGTLRAAVNEKLHGILFGWGEGGGVDEEALNTNLAD